MSAQPDQQGSSEAAPAVRERVITGRPGVPMFAAGLGVVLVGAALIAVGISLAANHNPGIGAALIVLGVPLVATGVLTEFGLTPILPGQARVVQLFGRYVGTARLTGLRCVNPPRAPLQVPTRLRHH